MASTLRSTSTTAYVADDADSFAQTTDLRKGRPSSIAKSRESSHNMLISPSPEQEGWASHGVTDWKIEDAQFIPSDAVEEKIPSIPIASGSKAAELTVAPYLANNIPQTYNPLNSTNKSTASDQGPNTKYCNRHRPDIKCRRQADEESMELIQTELNTLSNSDQQGISHVWSLFSAAPAKQRNLMLRGILSVCCFPQLSYISTTISDLIKIDFVSMLPPELSFKILCYLDTTSLCKAAQVSRRWRTLADDDVVWHRMCEQHIDRKCTRCGWGLPLMDRKRLRTEKRQIQLRASGRGMNDWSPNITPIPEAHLHSRAASAEPKNVNSPKRQLEPEATDAEKVSKRPCTERSFTLPVVTKRPWKDVYKARFKVGTNWKYGRCSTRILKGHTNGIMCLQFNDHILATGSYDATVKIWNIDSGQVIRTLAGHSAGIRCLQFDDTKLMSGSIDGTIRIWNWRTGECHRILHSQAGGIISLHFDAPFLACGTMQSIIRVWSTCDNSTFTLKGHTDFVNSVKVDAASRTLFSASDDCTVRLWDLKTRECLKIFEGHVGPVQQVLLLPPEFEFDEEEDLTKGGDANDTDTDRDCDETRSDSPHYEIRTDLHMHALRPLPMPSDPFNRTTPPPSLHTATVFPPESNRTEPPTYMLTGGLDSTIRLWHVPTARCLRTFFGHLEGIWALAADTLRVVSGAEDRVVKVWDPRTGLCERTFVGHQGPVTCIGLSGERLVSGGEDCEVRILEFHTEGAEENGH